MPQAGTLVLSCRLSSWFCSKQSQVSQVSQSHLECRYNGVLVWFFGIGRRNEMNWMIMIDRETVTVIDLIDDRSAWPEKTKTTTDRQRKKVKEEEFCRTKTKKNNERKICRPIFCYIFFTSSSYLKFTRSLLLTTVPVVPGTSKWLRYISKVCPYVPSSLTNVTWCHDVP